MFNKSVIEIKFCCIKLVAKFYIVLNFYQKLQQNKILFWLIIKVDKILKIALN